MKICTRIFGIKLKKSKINRIIKTERSLIGQKARIKFTAGVAQSGYPHHEDILFFIIYGGRPQVYQNVLAHILMRIRINQFNTVKGVFEKQTNVCVDFLQIFLPSYNKLFQKPKSSAFSWSAFLIGVKRIYLKFAVIPSFGFL